MNIPDKAAEAAARAVYESGSIGGWGSARPWVKETHRGQARIALEAAAPYIAARILRDVADVMEDQPVVDMTPVAYLRGRANVLDPA